MQAVILAGGFGTRLSEETTLRPKPMIEIGGKPILWHIMKIYSRFGINDFVICLGYKGYMVKEYFANYFLHTSNVTFDVRKNRMTVHKNRAEPWRVTLVDTGEATMSGGRIKRIGPYLKGETFCLTYGDGVGDVDIAELVRFHRRKRVLVTVTAVPAPGRFGALDMEGDRVRSFREKVAGDAGWINGGFFVVEKKALSFIEGDATTWEAEPLRELARGRHLAAYRHRGYWQAMDTLREKKRLDELWTSGRAPWKVWT